MQTRTLFSPMLQQLLDLAPSERATVVSQLSPKAAAALLCDWALWARPEQIAPSGEWRLWLVLAGRGFGKACYNGSMLPTPTGWTTIEKVQVGDTLFDERGQPCRVTYITPVMYERPCYDVVFDDGTVIVADAEHRWFTKTKAARKAEMAGRRIAGESQRAGRPQCERRAFPAVVTTEEIRATLRTSGGEVNHSIDVAGALDCPVADLPMDPYVFGAWLGDGDSAGATITTADPEVLDFIRAAGVVVGEGRMGNSGAAMRYPLGTSAYQRDPVTGRMVANGSLHSALKALGVRNNKHIPMPFQRASIAQRTALLQGLMDADGYVQANGNCEFVSTNERLAHDVWHLVLGLGFKATMGTGRATVNGRDCGPKYRVSFTPHRPVFRLARKLARQHSGKGQKERTRRRYIVDVRPRESVPVRCLTVDSPSHLFLISEACIPTHNTRTGAEWVRAQMESGRCSRMALVAPTSADARDVMVEGESGLLAISPPWNRPTYEPSKRRLTWPNGAIATTYSADEPDRLRGPQHDGGWLDELAAWAYPDAYDMLMLGLRLGSDPHAVATTTPRPTKLIRDLVAAKTTHVTSGRTYDNAPNLAPAFMEQIIARYAGTRLGRQELDAEILDDNPYALWKREQLEALRVTKHPDLSRVVIGVDPAVTSNEGSDETGIIGAGLATDGKGYVLEDASLRGTPHAWATAAVTLYHKLQADRIVAEGNQGGEMVEHTIRTVDPTVSVTLVHASRGKLTRAEPVAALYEQQKVHHAGTFPALEDQQCSWVQGDVSPDRLDALVWALTDLMLGRHGDYSLLEW